MVGYCGKILTKKFTGRESKKCYMKVVKWLAKNVVSNPNLNDQVTYSITKSQKDGMYVYTLKLFVRMDGEQVRDRHCAICKETHSLFFINQETNCNSCNLGAYFNRKKVMLQTKQQWAKEQILKGGGTNE